ncbi:MAG: DUF4368 domain-containing protein [Clostridia bacterium]|nr:DUF4368 domain-containing protein [Clostridia bacterium]
MQKTKKIYNAAIYLRLSKEDGDFAATGEKKESNSIANQRKLLEEYLKQHPDISFSKEFCDDGYTGTNFERPGFMEMIELVKQRKINCIIVKDLSRFGREYIMMGKYVEKIFPALGVRFIAINDNYDSAMAQETGNEIILPFKNLINDSYARDISIKVRTNLDVKRRNGEFVGNHVIYGYQRSEENKNQLLIDQAVAPIVESIFHMKLDGSSPAQIAEKLNQDGVPSPCEYKRICGSNYKTVFRKHLQSDWSAKAVYRILKNEMYAGTLVQGKTTSPNYKVKNRSAKNTSDWTRIENAHDAIIPSATFDLVQQLMLDDTRSPSGEDTVHLFSGKIFCQSCKGSMTRKRTHSKGKEYVYFVCAANKQNKKVCSTHSIKEQAVYDVVLAVIQSQVALALDLEQALSRLNGISWESRELERIEQRIDRQEEIIAHSKQMKASIYEDFKTEIITLEEYNIFKVEFDKKIKAAKETIAALHGNRNQVQGGLTEQQSWLAQFKQYENIQELNRRVVVNFIDRIEIAENKEISVVLNNADQFQAILEFLKEYQEKENAKKFIPFIREVS